MENKMKKILVTGFGPFDIVKENPTQKVIEQLSNSKFDHFDMIPYVFPVSFKKIKKMMEDLLIIHKPDIVIGLGLQLGTPAFRLERFALNLNDSEEPDVDGETPMNNLIYHDGITAYKSTLPLEEIKKELLDKNVPCVISNYAGTYVCNSLFYTTLYLINKHSFNIKAGFVHLPIHTEGACRINPANIASLHMNQLLMGTKLILETVIKY